MNPSSKSGLTEKQLEHFSGSTLFDRIARAVCRAGNLPVRHAFNELTRSEPESHQRRNALASIENIQNELASRAPCP